ncbi:MAG: ATP-binding cassette domain-containing protein, partial [Coriobacteriia bacterium]|nr:ATP-binding cassette domain-containing protein [Coriobacteriia bacterium]
MSTTSTTTDTRCQIQFKDVNKSFAEVQVLHHIAFCIEKGEFVTLIGGSGSGKTTILKMINGLITPDSGEIFVEGVNIVDKNAKEMIDLRRNIGYAIQESALFPHMSIEKNIGYVPTLLNGRDKQRTHETVRKWLDIVQLDESTLPRYPDELSGGQKQRVGIARSLAANPDILLMDEPFGAVDEITRKQLQTEIKRIHGQTGV